MLIKSQGGLRSSYGSILWEKACRGVSTACGVFWRRWSRMSVEFPAVERQARWLAVVGCRRSPAGRKAPDGSPQAGPGVCPLHDGR